MTYQNFKISTWFHIPSVSPYACLRHNDNTSFKKIPSASRSVYAIWADLCHLQSLN